MADGNDPLMGKDAIIQEIPNVPDRIYALLPGVDQNRLQHRQVGVHIPDQCNLHSSLFQIPRC
jgi:hypothetical protein